MSSHENATPIRVLHNSAGHLSGPARALGGVVVGYLGVRVFSPKPVATMIDNVGGCSVLLGKIENQVANDTYPNILMIVKLRSILNLFKRFNSYGPRCRIFVCGCKGTSMRSEIQPSGPTRDGS